MVAQAARRQACGTGDRAFRLAFDDRQRFKKEIKPWLKKEWVISAEQCGAFVASMEQVLDVYKRPYDPENPVVCYPIFN